MTRLRVRIASVFLCFQVLIATFAVAQVADNQIRVLAVSTNGVSSADVILQMNFLEFFGTPAVGVEIELANGGVPVPLGVTLSGSDFDRLNQAKANPTWQSYRSTWGADVMILFSTNMEGCGLAPQYNWASAQDPIPGEFIGDPLNFNLDLRGASNGYAAIVEVGGGCPPMMTAAHEMGHLLGSGHTYSVSEGLYLTNTSHAAAFVSETAPGQFTGFKTLGAQESNPPECVDEAIICQRVSFYSNGFFPSFPPNVPKANAIATFNITALSVANYYVGSGGGGHGGGVPGGPDPQCDDGVDNDGDGHTDYPNDPDCASLGDDDESDTGGGGGGGGGCGLQVPANLVATLVAVCSPPGWTQYTLTWVDFCPSASSYYQVYKEQPVASGFVFGWQSFVPSSPAFINGPPGLVKVRACNFSSCSGFSNTALLVDGC